jgi:hypothetical protein
MEILHADTYPGGFQDENRLQATYNMAELARLYLDVPSWAVAPPGVLDAGIHSRREPGTLEWRTFLPPARMSFKSMSTRMLLNSIRELLHTYRGEVPPFVYCTIAHEGKAARE